MRIETILVLTYILIIVSTSCRNTDSPEVHVEKKEVYSTFEKLKITQIEPRGWIRQFLERQKDGLTGHIAVAGYPFDTKMWAGEKVPGSKKAWWPYEQTAYYIDGVNRLGYLLNNDTLINIAKEQTDYVLSHIDPETKRVSTDLQDRWKRWPYAPFFRTFMTDYEASGNKRYVETLHNHYLTFTANDFADDLELANVEELCWLYDKTSDIKLLEMAEEAYRLFKSNPEYRNRTEGDIQGDIQFGSEHIPNYHGVVYLELVKIPAILFKYTGDSTYLEEAKNGLYKMEKYDMLASGLPSSTEFFKGISDTAGHETCNTAVFPYTYAYMVQITSDAIYGDKIEKAVFNAGIGSVTKDFKSHQYFSAPNQVIATLQSNLYGHNPARMAYAPGHDVECCTGNANRFMPYYVEQMWLRAPDKGLVASLYGPSTVREKVGINDTEIEIIENTDYPFSEEVNFTIKTNEKVTFPLYLRIPFWSKETILLLNGKEVNEKLIQGTFFILNRAFEEGDIVTLKMPMRIKTNSWPNNEISFERGPLVYSYPILETKTVVEDYKKSTTDFPAYEMRPAEPWNYGIDLAESQVKVETSDLGEKYPWEEGNSPVKIIVPARRVNNWVMSKKYDDILKENVDKSPAIPTTPDFGDNLEYITLVPYGCTTLRVSVFPEKKSENMVPNVADGRIERIADFKSNYVSSRNIDVWLPCDYSANKKYSVLYMNDGQTLFDASISWLNGEWNVDETMGKLLREGTIKDAIVVGIWNSGLGRVGDYCPQKPFESLPKHYVDSLRAAFNKVDHTRGMIDDIHSDNYLKFLVEELKPYIDKKYSTKPGKADTYIMGSSYGGLISMYAICEYPDVFEGAACLSTHWIVSFNDNPIAAQSFIDYFGKHYPDPANHKIYFDYGTETLDQYYETYQLKIDSIIKYNGYNSSNWETLKFEGKNHSEAAWSERLNIPLTFLLGSSQK